MYTYYDSAEDLRITYSRVLREIWSHGLPESEFASDPESPRPGPDGLYDAQELLRWLGY